MKLHGGGSRDREHQSQLYGNEIKQHGGLLLGIMFSLKCQYTYN